MNDVPTTNDTPLSSDGDAAMEDAVAAPMAEESKKDVKLEDLFADEDSDDEFPSSRPQDEPTSSAPEGAPSPV